MNSIFIGALIGLSLLCVVLTIALVVHIGRLEDMKKEQDDAQQAVQIALRDRDALEKHLASLTNQLKASTQSNLTLITQLQTAQHTISEQEAIYEDKLAVWKKQEAANIRKDALKKSTYVNTGFVAENFAPLMSEFHCKDFRHLGDPIDYLVCVGSEEIRNGTQEALEEVLLLDIKTGKAQLNKIQRRIRDAVAEGRVRFAVYHPESGSTRYWPPKEKE